MAKVRVLMNFKDKEANKERVVGDIFNCSETRYEFLKSHNAVELVEEEKEEIIEETENIEEEIIEEKPIKNKKRR